MNAWTCPSCGASDYVAVEYRGTSEDYDGTSERQCLQCNARIGRWTNRALRNGEIEPRYGVTRKALQ